MQCLLRGFQFYDFTVISFVTLNVNARNGEELFKSERKERHIAAVAVCFLSTRLTPGGATMICNSTMHL